MYTRLIEYANSRWLIHNDTLLSFLPLFLSFVNGAKFSALDFAQDQKVNTCFAVSPENRYQTLLAHSSPQGNLVVQRSITDESIPENSIAVIPIVGVLTTEKTQSIGNMVLQAQDNPQISSILFLVNSPGGMVNFIDITANTIKDCRIPSVAFVTGVAASAAMWLISPVKDIIASSPLDIFGSIGVMMKMADFDGFLKEKLGITFHEIYATKSTEKNNQLRELLKGNDKPIVANLDYANEMFHKTIIQNMGIKPDSEVLSGATYYSEQAISLGLAHRIASFNDAVDTAYTKGQIHRLKSFNLNF